MADLMKTLEDLIPEEIIDGSNVTETAEMVDLDIAFKLLVVVNPVGEDEFEVFNFIPPVELGIKRDDGKYEIRSTGEAGPDFKIYTSDDMKVMRARFLLLKGLYSSKLDMVSFPEHNKVSSLYEIHYIPNI